MSSAPTLNSEPYGCGSQQVVGKSGVEGLGLSVGDVRGLSVVRVSRL